MKTEDLKTLEDLANYVTIKKSDSEDTELVFVDFKYDSHDESNNKEIFGPDIFTEKVKMTNKFEIESIKNDLIKNIIELGNLNNSEIGSELSSKFSYTEQISMEDTGDIKRKLISKILNAGNYIAVYGRVGPAHSLLISEKNFEKYKLTKELLQNLEVLFDESIEDIFIFRKNTTEQPGLVLVHTEDKYEFVQIGFFPHRQFMKITLPKNSTTDAPTYKITTQEAIHKWKHVMENLKITDNEKLLLMSRYAEHHSQLNISINSTPSLSNISSIVEPLNETMLLPISLKMMSLLNFDNKIVLFMNKPMLTTEIQAETFQSDILLNEIDYKTLDVENKAEYLRQKENKLIVKAADIINNIIADSSIVFIYQMISQLTITEFEGNTKMFIRSRFTHKK